MTAIDWVGFDADDTLWRSEDYYRQAQADFERILADYIDLPRWAPNCTRWKAAT